ncbi:MAG TPA: hypothetical protein VFH80_10250 [Solirubrobacteraceae bacterium]|nr:hypothetical protein [Solirubrobacteraceae bacterium]
MTAPSPAKGHGKCGAARKGDRGPCTRPAGWGTDHPGVGRCKLHGGATPTHQRAAELEIARRECDRLGIQIEIDPGEALMQELWETAGNVAFYRAQVQQLSTHPEPDVFVPGDEDSDGYWHRGEPGVYGRVYHLSGKPTGEGKPHVLVSLYNEERRHLADVAAAALRAGVEERRVRMAENDAAQILGAQVSALVAMGLGDRLEEFRRAFVAALRPAEPARLGAAGAG